jgi:hypothetical protein
MSGRYEDSTGATGTLEAGGVEWFKAGLGAWHGRTPPGSAEMTAMVLRSDRSIGLERRPTPTPRGDQVLVDKDLCGIF